MEVKISDVEIRKNGYYDDFVDRFEWKNIFDNPNTEKEKQRKRE